jgi:small subunit ribosomal protein S17
MSKKIFTGIIVSDKTQNSIVVAINDKVAHPRYGKLLKRTKRLMADTNGMEVSIGMTVQIEEIRPMSKKKNFKVIKIINKEVNRDGTA